MSNSNQPDQTKNTIFEELPLWYSYLRRIGFVSLASWKMLSPDEMVEVKSIISSNIVGSNYIPFARCDDARILCWEQPDAVKIYMISYYEKNRDDAIEAEFDSIWEWMNYVVEELKMHCS